MDKFLMALVQILTYTIPALIVWGVVYWMGKTFLRQRWDEQYHQQRMSIQKETMPLKIQALERLSLFCERIQPNQVLSRVRSQDMDANALGRAMLIAVQKEFEHNVTQQIYVSSALWEIIYLAKNEVLNLITEAMDQQGPGASAADLARTVIGMEGQWQLNPIRQALQAIRKEASIILNP